MLGSRCEYGEDRTREGQFGFRPGNGLSFLAFDFVRELLVIKATLAMSRDSLPYALRPLDAELSFDDIAAQGIHIVHREIPPPPSRRGKVDAQYEVTVTVTCRRPPKFFTEFENEKQLGRSAADPRLPYRRRATAMDFAITPVVRAFMLHG